MRGYKVVRNTLDFTPDLSGCQNIEDIAARLRRDYPEDDWSVYEGGNHAKMCKIVKAPVFVPHWLFFLFASDESKHVFEAHTQEI